MLLVRLGIPKVGQSDGGLLKNTLLGRCGVPKVAKSDGVLLQSKVSGIRQSHPADPPDPPEMGSGPAAQTLPSTRAGGQDDVCRVKV